MKTQRTLTIISSIIIGLLALFNVVIIAILGLLKKRYWLSGIAAALLVLTIVLMLISENNTASILGGFTVIFSMVYSAIAFYYIITPTLPANKAEEGTGSSRTEKSPEKEQSLNDILQDIPDKVEKQVKINEAFEDQISEIPQITLIDAKKIVDERVNHGIFHDFKDFSERNRLPATTLKRIQPYLDFSTPEQTASTPNTGRRIDF